MGKKHQLLYEELSGGAPLTLSKRLEWALASFIITSFFMII